MVFGLSKFVNFRHFLRGFLHGKEAFEAVERAFWTPFVDV
jgi:hypothetical protein